MSAAGNILGLDIGGANIKLSTDDGSFTTSLAFPMWSQPDRLADRLGSMLAEFESQRGQYKALAVTMTGELADCFESKRAGVQHICEAVTRAATAMQEIWFYQTGGNWSRASEAHANWLTLAASNWHAMAQYCSQQFATGSHIVIDIGTTTTDLIPISDGEVHTDAIDDITRLQRGQLVYCGVERTPLSSLMQQFSLDGIRTPIARELFATTLDTFLMSGEIAERPDCTETADGHPATKQAAARRFARLVCQCPTLISEEQLQEMTNQSRHAVVQLIQQALHQVTADIGEPVRSLILAGQGDFLIPDIAPNHEVHPLRNLFPHGADSLARIGPAAAVATLLNQHLKRI